MDYKGHEGDCCGSCIEEAEYDYSYSLYPKCCCRDDNTYEEAERMRESSRPQS